MDVSWSHKVTSTAPTSQHHSLSRKKRKRVLVQQVKDTLKRSCLAKIRAQYLSSTHHIQKSQFQGECISNGDKEALKYAAAQAIHGCRQKLDIARQGQDMSILFQTQQASLLPGDSHFLSHGSTGGRVGLQKSTTDVSAIRVEAYPTKPERSRSTHAMSCKGGDQAINSGSYPPTKVLKTEPTEPQNLFVGEGGGKKSKLHDEQMGICATPSVPTSVAASGQTDSSRSWYDDPDQIDEDDYVEIMQFLEEKIISEVEKMASSTVANDDKLIAEIEAAELEDIESISKLYDHVEDEASSLGMRSTSGTGSMPGAATLSMMSELQNSIFGAFDAFDVLCPICEERYLRQHMGAFSCKCGFLLPMKDAVMDLKQLQELLANCYTRHSNSGCNSQKIQFSVETQFGVTWLKAVCQKCDFLCLI